MVFVSAKIRLHKIVDVMVDTDVIAIALYAYWELDVDNFWVEFG